MRSREQIIQDQAAFGSGGGNSLLLEVLMDIRDLINIYINPPIELKKENLIQQNNETNANESKPFRLI